MPARRVVQTSVSGRGGAGTAGAVPRLRYVDLSSPGRARRRRGRGFEILDADGNRVEDEATLDRVRDLAVPPAWTDVWICPFANGHIQAVGTDAAGRRQYLYHAAWREARDADKFERMLAFSGALPRLRRRVAADLQRKDVGRERVLACAARLLDRGFFRAGGEAYAESNETFGLATLLKRHVRVGPDGLLLFDYPAKGGLRRRQRVVDPEAFAVVRRLKQRRNGTELLAYRNGGRWIDVRSSDVNDYIRAASRGDFTAKDFRTWHATVLAAAAISVYGQAATSPAARARAVTQAVREVAHYLGNTPAVCRASYIDPRVFERYAEGRTVAAALRDVEALIVHEPQSSVERAVRRLLRTR
jgi:DNA topoisomerase IB